MTQVPRPTAAEQLDEPLEEGNEVELDAEDLAALRAVIARGRAASEEECISAEEALAELDAITFGP